MKAPTEVARPASRAPPGVKLTAGDMVRVRTIAAALRRSSGFKPLVLGGRDATATADAIASELGQDLLRVDLSKVVSKYIGETEKHLAQVFAAAEASAAMLVFDEADALFGKRSGVRDAHDRYPNAQINSLLRGLRRHNGLVVFVSKNMAAIPIKLRPHFSFYHFPPVDPR